jgi:hypothetical protein
MKPNGTVVYITELQAKCVKMGWHMGTQKIINFTNAAGSTINVIHQCWKESTCLSLLVPVVKLECGSNRSV